MRSDPSSETLSDQGAGFWSIARSQGLGFACGMATVFLLAIGSVVLVATSDGASARVAMDDITVFFTEPRWVHTWFYVLVWVMAVYGANTLLATWHSVRTKWVAGVRAPARFGPSVIHLGFLLTLVAHLVGGVWGQHRGAVVVGDAWTSLPDGRSARLDSLNIERLPNGQTKQVQARLQVRAGDGEVQAHAVAYNRPISEGLGSELLLLAQAENRGHRVRLSSARDRCTATVRGVCVLEDVRLFVVEVHNGGHWGTTPAVRLAANSKGQGAFFLTLGNSVTLGNGLVVRLDGIETAPTVVLRGRYAPGNPWALVSACVMLAGMVMMGRRWFGRA